MSIVLSYISWPETSSLEMISLCRYVCCGRESWCNSLSNGVSVCLFVCLFVEFIDQQCVLMSVRCLEKKTGQVESFLFPLLMTMADAFLYLLALIKLCYAKAPSG